MADRVALDANILIVLAFGAIDITSLGRKRRVKEYMPEDYQAAIDFISGFKQVVVTPNVVTVLICFQMMMTFVRRNGSNYFFSPVIRCEWRNTSRAIRPLCLTNTHIWASRIALFFLLLTMKRCCSLPTRSFTLRH